MVGALGLLLMISLLLWRALTVVSATPTVQANTPSPSLAPQRWQASADMPAAQSAFAVAAYNNQIYAIAGKAGETLTNAVNRYDPITDQWTTLSPKPIPVAEVNAAVVGGQIYIPGGRLASGAVTSTVEVYNPDTDTWEQRAPLPIALSAYALASFEGRIYLFGGWDGDAYRADVLVYDPGQDVWAKLPAMPTARGHAGVAVAGNQIYVIGGSGETSPLTHNEAFNPNTQTWLTQAPLPVGRANMGMTTIADHVYLVGGEGELGPALTLQYSPAQDEWQTFEAPADITRWRQLGLAVLNGQRLFAFGGEQNGQMTSGALSYQVIYTLVIPIIK
jgi:N-acetylneuraminic acid mutarotase